MKTDKNKNEHKFRIGEIADIYNVPVTTLHYWEREGLFHTIKNSENGYREFQLGRTLVELGDVVFYRNINIPLNEMKKIKDKSAAELSRILITSREKLKNQIENIESKIDTINLRLNIIDEILNARKDEFVVSTPPFSKAISFEYDDKENVTRYLKNPNDFVIVGTPEQGLYVMNCLAVSGDCDNGNVDWERGDKKYIMSHFKVKLYDVKTTDFFEVTESAKKAGYKPKAFVAQFLINMNYDGERYDFYRIWYEV